MKNITEVEAEILETSNEGAAFKRNNERDWGHKEESKYKTFGTRTDFLRTVLKYLESEPRKEFVEKQLSDMKKKDKYIDDNLSVFLKNLPYDDVRPIPEKKEEWYRLNNRTAVRLQLKTLNYLLSK